MITIIIDDKKFTLSMGTLNANPQFVITQMLNGLIPANGYSFIERINETTFEVDMDPQQFALIVQDLRKEPRNMFTQTKIQNKGSIFQKSSQMGADVPSIDAMIRQFGGFIPNHGNSTTDAHSLNLTESVTNNKIHVLKPRKIELDTSENKN